MSEPTAPTAAEGTAERRRNEIFSGGAKGQDVPRGALPPSLAAEFGFDIPRAVAPIVSNGLVYPEGSPLHKLTQVEIRAMTARDEDILTSRALIKKGTVITHLLQSCMIDKSINVNDLILSDRNAIMVSLRIVGYGPMYEVQMSCPECEEKNNVTFDLNKMEVKRLEIKPIKEGMNIFEMKLPMTGATVHWRFLTAADETDMMKAAEAKKKVRAGATDNLITDRLLRSIVSINGKSDRNKLAQIVPYLPSPDSRAFREHLDEHEPGIDMKAPFECEFCGHSEETEVPINAGFFWPGSK